MVTPHINAPDGAFASTVLLPGDPLRARHIATEHLDDAEQVTDVRAMAGFTGTFAGTPVSVMATGMGMPSAAIYITELIRSYGVTRLVRVGTTGAYQPDLALRSIVAADRAVTNSNLPNLIRASEPLVPSADLLDAATATATARGVELAIGTVLTSDVFYEPDDRMRDEHTAAGVLCVEMETAALYAIAALEGAHALTLLTVSDHLVTGDHLSSHERQTTVDEMIDLALHTVTAQD